MHDTLNTMKFCISSEAPPTPINLAMVAINTAATAAQVGDFVRVSRLCKQAMGLSIQGYGYVLDMISHASREVLELCHRNCLVKQKRLAARAVETGDFDAIRECIDLVKESAAAAKLVVSKADREIFSRYRRSAHQSAARRLFLQAKTSAIAGNYQRTAETIADLKKHLEIFNSKPTETQNKKIAAVLALATRHAVLMKLEEAAIFALMGNRDDTTAMLGQARKFAIASGQEKEPRYVGLADKIARLSQSAAVLRLIVKIGNALAANDISYLSCQVKQLERFAEEAGISLISVSIRALISYSVMEIDRPANRYQLSNADITHREDSLDVELVGFPRRVIQSLPMILLGDEQLQKIRDLHDNLVSAFPRLRNRRFSKSLPERSEFTKPLAYQALFNFAQLPASS